MSARHKHTPTAHERHVGIELEFDAPGIDKSVITTAPAKRGMWPALEIDHEHITWSPPRGLSMYGYEAALLARVEEYPERVKGMCAVIEAVNGFVDERCGLHVHLDMRHDPDGRRVVCDRLFDAQDRLYSMVHPDRRTNRECRPVRRKGDYGNKGQGFWIAGKYPTVEVRMHEATLDPVKIIGWVAALHEIAGLS